MTALPLGYIADRFSRRNIMAVILGGMLAGIGWTLFIGTTINLSILGTSVETDCRTGTHSNLPLRLVWLTSVFYLCGGGNPAAEMMLGVIVADACVEADR